MMSLLKYNRYVATHVLIIFLLLGLVTAINVCEYKKCRPNCLCDIRFDDVCAMDYGNYGWKAPESGDGYLYRHMRPDVSDVLNES